jgi:uncharacterized protein YkuJ
MSLFFARSFVFPALLLAGPMSTVNVYNEDFGRIQKENLKNNNVKSVTGWTFTYKDGTPVKNGVRSSEEHFDQKGNRIEEIRYDEKGVSMKESTFSYDEEGVELRNIGVDNHKPFYNNWVYEFNDTTNELTRMHSQFRLNKEKWVYKYDVTGNKVEERYFDLGGVYVEHTVLKYDGKGKLSERIVFDAYDNLNRKTIYTYDEKGNNISEVTYNSDMEILNQYSMKYDDKGNLTTRFEMDAKGITRQMTVFLYEFYTTTR